MAIVHKGVDKIIDGSGNEIIIADVQATVQNQVNKADATHDHGIAALTDVAVAGAADGQVLAYTSNLNSTGSPGWEAITVTASGSGAADLGIAVNVSGSDVDYEFNATTPSGVPSMDTSSLPSGSTMSWNGTNWVNSGLIIEII